ncbi:GNAT family N-acetyltransferase [Candidatus Epulonipiscium viviparus]|uniref:GNAT family N-acetyltransferase n=1 Tax=Candidatus Epulonipiscium viviparus TaxID=420336 RepID=UPI0027380792|nr:GNAT family N-acetyltransferase [Candidatus Epulopiscium viviparus]
MIKEVKNKKQFLELLLLADEQESMIDRYLENGTMYALYDEKVLRTICVVAVVKGKTATLEIKNIATVPEFQRCGYGYAMIEYLANAYADDFAEIIVGTGESRLTIPFYEKCGFTRSHVAKNFFVDNYDHPIYENGIQLVDMIYLKRTL